MLKCQIWIYCVKNRLKISLTCFFFTSLMELKKNFSFNGEKFKLPIWLSLHFIGWHCSIMVSTMSPSLQPPLLAWPHHFCRWTAYTKCFECLLTLPSCCSSFPSESHHPHLGTMYLLEGLGHGLLCTRTVICREEHRCAAVHSSYKLWACDFASLSLGLFLSQTEM